MGFILLVVTSAALTIIGLLVAKRYGHEQPPMLSCSLFVAALYILGAQVIPLVMGATPEGTTNSGGALGGVMLLSFLMLIAFPPIAVLGFEVSGSLSDAAVRASFDSSIVSPQPSDFSRARALGNEENINGALKEYRKYYEENPKRPTPLFAAAQFLESMGRYTQARDYYEEINEDFHKNRIVWAESSLRLASLYHNDLDEREESETILRKVLFRMRGLEQGKIASQRLLGRAAL